MSHFSKNGGVWYCVAGGIGVGAIAGWSAARWLFARSYSDTDAERNMVWEEPGSYKHPDGTPQGFTMRQVVHTADGPNPSGVDVMMEKWTAGSEEPPHSHPGDDMTIVVEGCMSIQYYEKMGTKGGLKPVGSRIYLNAGDVGYIKAGDIHDAKYHNDCKLVYVHNKAFGFNAAS
jgi:quercetin dioxygenase-like cupin family protein